MKTFLKRILLLSSVILLSASLSVSVAQVLPPQPPSNGAGGNQGPTGAPLDDGVGMSLLLAAAYGAYIVFRMRKTAQKPA